MTVGPVTTGWLWLSLTTNGFVRTVSEPQSQLEFFPNNKPWVTKELKIYPNKKKFAFVRGNKAEVRELDEEFRRKAKLAKLAYKDKVEEKLKVGNAKDAWRELNTMMGRKNNQQTVKGSNPRGFANELNRFYAKFDVTDFSSERDNICRSLVQVRCAWKREM